VIEWEDEWEDCTRIKRRSESGQKIISIIQFEKRNAYSSAEGINEPYSLKNSFTKRRRSRRGGKKNVIGLIQGKLLRTRDLRPQRKKNSGNPSSLSKYAPKNVQNRKKKLHSPHRKKKKKEARQRRGGGRGGSGLSPHTGSFSVKKAKVRRAGGATGSSNRESAKETASGSTGRKIGRQSRGGWGDMISS